MLQKMFLLNVTVPGFIHDIQSDSHWINCCSGRERLEQYAPLMILNFNNRDITIKSMPP